MKTPPKREGILDPNLLYEAVSWGDPERLQNAFDAGKFEVAALSEAIGRAASNASPLRYQMVEMLHRKCANQCVGEIERQMLANAQTQGLQTAAKRGDVEMVKRFAQMGANLRTDDDMVFQTAAANGQTDVCRLLVGAGASVISNGRNALLAAIAGTDKKQPNWETVEFLFKQAHGNCEHRALDLAASQTHSDAPMILSTVLANGHFRQADLNHALLKAVESLSYQNVRLLMSRGADPTAISIGARAFLSDPAKSAVAFSLLKDLKKDPPPPSIDDLEKKFAKKRQKAKAGPRYDFHSP